MLRSRGKETTLVGSRTYRALIRYPKAHGSLPTGFFGPLTRSMFTSRLVSADPSHRDASVARFHSKMTYKLLLLLLLSRSLPPAEKELQLA